MTYQFKESIQNDLGRLDDLNGDGSLQFEEKVKELDVVYRDSETLHKILEIFNDARKPISIAEEEIYEMLRGEQE